MKSASYIFVYGTLMSCFDNEMSRYLQQSAKYVGKGTLNGLLYNMGTYPGAIFDQDCKKVVYGEVYKLDCSTKIKVLYTLDVYEGITGTKTDEYLRMSLPVITPISTIDCWVYVLTNKPDNDILIPNGNYNVFMKLQNKNPRSQ